MTEVFHDLHSMALLRPNIGLALGENESGKSGKLLKGNFFESFHFFALYCNAFMLCGISSPEVYIFMSASIFFRSSKSQDSGLQYFH